MGLIQWRSRKAKALVLQALMTARPLFARDFADYRNRPATDEVVTGEIVQRSLKESTAARADAMPSGRKTIFISACVDAARPGGWRYNGGIKEYNQLVKLLRSKGHDAFIVTFDGTYEPWLMDHQPTISLDEFQERLREDPEARCVTSWIIADAYLRHTQKFYFWDMELFYTDNDHFAALAKYHRYERVVKTVGISRTIQAWHMAHFDRPSGVLPNLIDLEVWTPDATRRVEGRIGYMEEGAHTQAFVATIESDLMATGCRAEFVRVSGDERTCLELMQTCDLFMNMNVGKDLLWGEGCPRTIIESMAAGCVNLSFDIVGNREVVIDGYNAVIVRQKTPGGMSDSIGSLLADRSRMETMRRQAQDVLHSCHTVEKRWPCIEEFLEL